MKAILSPILDVFNVDYFESSLIMKITAGDFEPRKDMKLRCITWRFFTWKGQPAGMNTASPICWWNVQGSIPIRTSKWKLQKYDMMDLNSKVHF